MRVSRFNAGMRWSFIRTGVVAVLGIIVLVIASPADAGKYRLDCTNETKLDSEPGQLHEDAPGTWTIDNCVCGHPISIILPRAALNGVRAPAPRALTASLYASRTAIANLWRI